jgi:hypothetical protein
MRFSTEALAVPAEIWTEMNDTDVLSYLTGGIFWRNCRTGDKRNGGLKYFSGCRRNQWNKYTLTNKLEKK